VKNCDDVIVHIKKEGKTMREIKFRGKRIDTGEWIYGSLVQQFDEENRMHTAIVAYSECWMAFVTTWVISKTVGQYTGVKDKNGVDVYEGDIIRVSEYDSWYSNNNNVLRKIMWCNNSLTWVLRDENRAPIPKYIVKDKDLGLFYESEIEIIGNIYDNPKLKMEANKNEQRL